VSRVSYLIKSSLRVAVSPADNPRGSLASTSDRRGALRVFALLAGLFVCAEGLIGCGGGRATGNAARETSIPLPPYPEVSIRRSGSTLIVRYCFSSVPTSRERAPWQIITAVDSKKRDQLPPFTLRTKMRLPCGRVESWLGYAKPPLVLRVAIMSRTGAQTPSRTYRIPA
jgi:hypothetical protein